ncbi:hypothetical protein [[Scytonema hofmanni] UTEX B 1581]|uniref:hypothetical protein n=1 Tax=[Scytonema hofmanni] UTEX B 1581 TaxID=379535 RepID=UPI00163F5A04|nr:hypothetical protein [[Scytonema hofmanni] UTEX B 1581]
MGIGHWGIYSSSPLAFPLPHSPENAKKKPTDFFKRLSAISVFPINDSARVQLYVIMLVYPFLEDDLNHGHQ